MYLNNSAAARYHFLGECRKASSPELALPGWEAAAQYQGLYVPVWQVLVPSLPVLSESTRNSLFWVQCFGVLALKIARVLGSMEGGLVGCLNPMLQSQPGHSLQTGPVAFLYVKQGSTRH